MKAVYKFTDTDKNIDEKIIDDYIINIYKKVTWTFWLYNLMNYWTYKQDWYNYDFKDILQLYIVKQSSWLREYYAPNKTLLRNNLIWDIAYILEVK